MSGYYMAVWRKGELLSLSYPPGMREADQPWLTSIADAIRGADVESPTVPVPVVVESPTVRLAAAVPAATLPMKTPEELAELAWPPNPMFTPGYAPRVEP